MKKLLVLLSLASAMSTTIYSAAGIPEEIKSAHGKIALGAGGIVDLGNVQTLDAQLFNMPTRGANARYTIGSRNIKPTVKIVERILQGDTNLSEAEEKDFLICTAAALRLVNPASLLGGLLLEENQNVRFDGTNFSGLNVDKSITYLSKDNLLKAYEIFKDHLKEQNLFMPVPLEPEAISAIEKIKSAAHLVENPKRPGNKFTSVEKGLGISITQETPIKTIDAYMTGLCRVFSPQRAKAILDDIFGASSPYD